MTTSSERPSWDDWGLAIASAVALRADCSRRKVGAVLMTPDHSIVATGYNGAAPGEMGCLAGGCPRGQSDVPPGSSYDTGPGTCVAIHAEQNALLRASWSEQAGSTMYVTETPCEGCLRTISGSRIKRVIAPFFTWNRHHEFQLTVNMRCGICGETERYCKQGKMRVR